MTEPSDTTYTVDFYRSPNDGQHRWRLVAENGRIVADSAEGYVRESDARTMAEQIFAGAPNVKMDDEPAF